MQLNGTKQFKKQQLKLTKNKQPELKQQTVQTSNRYRTKLKIVNNFIIIISNNFSDQS